MEQLRLLGFQFTIADFTNRIKKDRVPAQKPFIKSVQYFLQSINAQSYFPEQQLLIYALCQVSKPICQFFEFHFINIVQNYQIQTPEINLYQFQLNIIDQIKSHILSIVTNQGFELILEQSQNQLADLTVELSEQVCAIFEDTRGYIESLIKQFNEQCTMTLIMNKYMMFMLFEELSHRSHQIIQDLLDFTIFHYAEPEFAEKFITQSILYFDIASFKNKTKVSIQNKDNANSLSLQQKIQQTQDTINMLFVNKTQKLYAYIIQNQQFNQGLYIESDDPKLKFIIFSSNNQPKIVYAPLISSKWCFQKTYVIDPQDQQIYFKNERKSGWGIYPIIFSNLKELTESDWFQERLAQIFSLGLHKQQVNTDQFAIDTMLGYFIAYVTRNMNFQLFGENAVANGCINHLIQQVPLIGEYLNVGGFGKTALVTHSQMQAPQRIIAPVSRLVIQTGTSLGTAVSGAIIGQILIPIPVVGTIVGGLLGGYLGNKGASEYITKRNQSKLQDAMKIIEQNQNEQGSWDNSTIQALKLTQKVANEYLPKNLKNNYDIWCNLILFCYLTVQYSWLDRQGKQNNKEIPESIMNCQKWIFQINGEIIGSLQNLKVIMEIILKNM